jgi:preprotein translocase subunit SecG
MHILLYFLITLHVLVCFLIVLVVLMQRPRNEGLGAAFGSGMTENIFGAQTTHVLAKFTTYLGGTFFLLTLALAMVYSHLYNGESVINKQLLSLPEPKAAAATPAPVDKPLPAQSAATATPATETPSAAALPATSQPAVAPAAPAPQPVSPLAPATPAPAAP